MLFLSKSRNHLVESQEKSKKIENKFRCLFWGHQLTMAIGDVVWRRSFTDLHKCLNRSYVFEKHNSTCLCYGEQTWTPTRLIKNKDKRSNITQTGNVAPGGDIPRDSSIPESGGTWTLKMVCSETRGNDSEVTVVMFSGGFLTGKKKGFLCIWDFYTETYR